MDTLENGQALQDYIQVRLLLDCPLSHVEHDLDLLLVVGYVLHVLKLLLQLIEFLIKFFGLLADGTPARATGGRRHQRVGRSGSDL